jgi:hypothetical protein
MTLIVQTSRLTGGDLFDYILRNVALQEPQAKFIAYQTLKALQVS